MGSFRVALSGDFRGPDESFGYPDMDLTPLDHEPGLEWSWIPATSPIEAGALAGYDALILLGLRMEAASFPEDGRLAVVARFGVGFDSVDVPACTDHACALVTTPDGVRRPVAIAVITFMLALMGRLPAKDRITRQGPEGWAKRQSLVGRGLIGQTLGQLGMGNIGAEVFRLARPFEMRFIAHDPNADPSLAQELGVELVDLATLFREADVLSVSCPLNPETRGIVSAERIGLMKPSAYLINTSRGAVVEQAALVAALEAGRIAGAGLDVFEDEPYPADHPLNALDNVILSPHALCWTDQCFAGIGAADAQAVLDVKRGRLPNGIVNREVATDPRFQAKLQHYAAASGGRS